MDTVAWWKVVTLEGLRPMASRSIPNPLGEEAMWTPLRGQIIGAIEPIEPRLTIWPVEYGPQIPVRHEHPSFPGPLTPLSPLVCCQLRGVASGYSQLSQDRPPSYKLRKYRVGMVLLTRYLSQLDPQVRDAILGMWGQSFAFGWGWRMRRFEKEYFDRGSSAWI